MQKYKSKKNTKIKIHDYDYLNEIKDTRYCMNIRFEKIFSSPRNFFFS